MTNSVSTSSWHPSVVAGNTAGALDRFEHVDGTPGLVAHPRRQRVPLGAPVIAGGWAVVGAPPGTVPEAVTIVLDGARAYEAKIGLSRGDIAAERPGTPERVGYEGIVPTADLRPGGHELRAFALAAGAWYEAGYRPFWLAATPLTELPTVPRRLRISVEQVVDLAADGAVLGFDKPVPEGRFALLTGWAVDPKTHRGVAGAVAFGGSSGRWSAPCDVVRSDQRGPMYLRDDRIGFELVIPTGALGRGRHVLRVAGFDEEGRIFDGDVEATIDVAGPDRPFPAFARRRNGTATAAAVLSATDRPDASRVPLPGTLERGTVAVVEGWALDRGGLGAETVFVVLAPAGAAVPPHRYPALAGFRRDDAPRTIASPPVEDGWFRARIDTEHLPARAYEASLAVVDRDRRTYTCRELGLVTVVESAGGTAGSSRRT